MTDNISPFRGSGGVINCIIIDDEPLARKGLKEYIADIDFMDLVGEFDNPLKASELLSKGNVHLLFLDIQMPKITGIDFFKSLQTCTACNFYNRLSPVCSRWF